MIQNRLQEIWDAGQAVVNAWLHIPHSYPAEVIARAGFDAVTCDMQHGLIDYSDLVAMLTAISATSAVPLVRVPGLEPPMIGRVLDAGVLGVICPMINTPEQAGRLISACRYAPKGQRSFGPNRAGFLGADYVQEANGLVVPFAMIETAEALANLDAILATEGMRALYVGPADLALSLGCTPKADPTERRVVEAIEHIVKRARDKSIIAGIHSRMQAKGEATPSYGDVAAGAADGMLNTVGGGMAHGVIGPVASRLLGPVGERIAARLALNATVGAGLGAANNVAATAGTGQMSGSDVLSDAVEGAGPGAMATGAGSAADILHTVLQERGASSLHPDQAASIVRVANMASERVAAAQAAGQKIAPADALSTIGQQLQGELGGQISSLKSAGQVSPMDHQAVIAPLLQQAKAGTLLPSDAAVPSTPLAQFDALGLPAGSASLLRNGLLDLSTINRDGQAGNGVLKPIIDKFTGHNTARMLEATLGGLAGFHAGGPEGAALGGAAGVVLPALATTAAGSIDRAIGANAPPVMGQQAMAQAALRRAGLPAGLSSLAALQAARQSAASAEDSGPTAEQAGAAKAAENQAGMIARLGPDHPVGAAALAALRAGGNEDMVNQALAQYQAMAPVRSVQAAGVAHDVAARHQLNIDAADATPGGAFGIDAVNAATRELGQKARATMRLAGAAADSGSAPGVGQAGPGITGPGAASTPPSASSGGLMGLSDHLAGQALWGSGVQLTPAEIQIGLAHAAAAGKITPEQYAVLNQHLTSNIPLHHTGGAATGALNTVLAHAMAAKTGINVADIPPAPGGTSSQPNGGDRPVQNVHQWSSAANTYQADLQDRINAAERSGDANLAAVLRNIRSVPEIAAKQALASAYIDSLGTDPVARAKARVALGGRVLTQGK